MRFQLLSAGGSSSRFHSRYPTSGENYSCSSSARAFDCITPQFSTDDFGGSIIANKIKKRKNRNRSISPPLNRLGQDSNPSLENSFLLIDFDDFNTNGRFIERWSERYHHIHGKISKLVICSKKLLWLEESQRS